MTLTLQPLRFFAIILVRICVFGYCSQGLYLKKDDQKFCRSQPPLVQTCKWELEYFEVFRILPDLPQHPFLLQLEGVHRTLTPRRALDVVREVGAWIWIRDREQGYHNKREAAISHGRIRRSTRGQQSHTEEHERIRRIARGANNKK